MANRHGRWKTRKRHSQEVLHQDPSITEEESQMVQGCIHYPRCRDSLLCSGNTVPRCRTHCYTSIPICSTRSRSSCSSCNYSTSRNRTVKSNRWRHPESPQWLWERGQSRGVTPDSWYSSKWGSGSKDTKNTPDVQQLRREHWGTSHDEKEKEGEKDICYQPFQQRKKQKQKWKSQAKWP